MRLAGAWLHTAYANRDPCKDLDSECVGHLVGCTAHMVICFRCGVYLPTFGGFFELLLFCFCHRFRFEFFEYFFGLFRMEFHAVTLQPRAVIVAVAMLSAFALSLKPKPAGESSHLRLYHPPKRLAVFCRTPKISRDTCGNVIR